MTTKTVWDDEIVVEKLLVLVRAGLPGYLAAKSIGLDHSAFYRMMRRGGSETFRGDRDFVEREHAREPYKTVSMLVEQAEAHATGALVQHVHRKALRGNGELALKLLKATNPRDFGGDRATQSVHLDPVINVLSIEDIRQRHNEIIEGQLVPSAALPEHVLQALNGGDDE